ncbi:hypothetical protein [Streptomonospora litoralis]|uniref:hypothetical protein n=1 Tax=Streptomonospora litoralis TaxID=2498135 RepID=UPI0010366926|nr:hypothetical protein [Streptomonospora litoralis]
MTDVSSSEAMAVFNMGQSRRSPAETGMRPSVPPPDGAARADLVMRSTDHREFPGFRSSLQ